MLLPVPQTRSSEQNVLRQDPWNHCHKDSPSHKDCGFLRILEFYVLMARLACIIMKYSYQDTQVILKLSSSSRCKK